MHKELPKCREIWISSKGLKNFWKFGGIRHPSWQAKERKLIWETYQGMENMFINFLLLNGIKTEMKVKCHLR